MCKKKNGKKAICFICNYHIVDSTRPNSDIWYDQYCGVHPKKQNKDHKRLP